MEEGAEMPKTFSIGPVTSKLMKELHVPLVREAKESTLDGLIAAILDELLES